MVGDRPSTRAQPVEHATDFQRYRPVNGVLAPTQRTPSPATRSSAPYAIRAARRDHLIKRQVGRHASRSAVQTIDAKWLFGRYAGDLRWFWATILYRNATQPHPASHPSMRSDTSRESRRRSSAARPGTDGHDRRSLL